jgi:hypothetical protein
VFVFVDDAAEAVASADVEVGDPMWVATSATLGVICVDLGLAG